jgi:hypothetical protein
MQDKKLKIQLTTCLSNHTVMKACGGDGDTQYSYLDAFLTSALDGGEWPS